MREVHISRIYPDDRKKLAQADALMAAEGIRRDAHLECLWGLYDREDNLVATGGCYGNTLRCVAVGSAYRSEGLTARILTHLVNDRFSNGYDHLFLYTKCSSAGYFADLGFYEIVRIEDEIVFMENRRTGFDDYLNRLERPDLPGSRAAAIVLNANPFTLGHQYLAETAAAENDVVHLFLVSEDASLFPYSVRKELVRKGTEHLPNVLCHDSGSYMISRATFPAYFQKDDRAAIRSQAALDLAIFGRIAKTLGITRRYVGEEHASLVTGLYNSVMETRLPEMGIECRVIPRKETGNGIISASAVRQAIKDGRISQIADMLPKTTREYLDSPEAANVIQRIMREDRVIHY